MDNEPKKVDLALPPKMCHNCGMQLNPGGAHLVKDMCIRDLQVAIAQLSQLHELEQAKVKSLLTASRLVYIMVSELPDRRRIFTPKELNEVPKNGQIHSEAGPEGLVVTATLQAAAHS